ncbi:MAG: ABC transporter permease [Anaerolineales bacterium]|jgi:ABC-2 type transport system permease protein
MLRRVWAVTLKEIRHIVRDRLTLALVTLMPTLLLFLLAYAVTSDVVHVPVAVLDLDRSPTSRAFVQQITVGEDLDLYAQVADMQEVESLLLHGRVKAAVIIPPAFETDLMALRGLPLQIVIDGTEPQSGGFAVDHIGGRAEDFAANTLAKQLRSRGISEESLQPLDMRVRTWYNPNLKASVDLVPGLLSITLSLPGISVALTLAREREHGTMEQLMATPIGRAELLLGKMAPYVVSGLLNVVLATVAAKVGFNVPFHGNFALYMLLSAVYFYAILSLGIILGVLVRTQPAALALSFLVMLFPGFFLTGIFFPLAAMPAIMRTEAMALPGTHHAIITRASFITGLGWEELWPYGLALLAMGVVYTGIAAFMFKKKLA